MADPKKPMWEVTNRYFNDEAVASSAESVVEKTSVDGWEPFAVVQLWDNVHNRMSNIEGRVYFKRRIEYSEPE